MTLQPPTRIIVNEIRGEHVGSGHVPQKLGLVSQLLGVVRCRCCGTRQPERHTFKVSDQHRPGFPIGLFQDRRLIQHNSPEHVSVELFNHLVVRDVKPGGPSS